MNAIADRLRSGSLGRAATLVHPRTMAALWAQARPRPGGDAEHLDATLSWLGHAHDAAGGQGVSARFDVARGWDRPYPETTGYIIPTMLHHARISDSPGSADRAVAMGDWLLSLQQPEGWIAGGLAREGGAGRPEVFNTGQVLFGWLALFEEGGHERFASAAARAAQWLASVQEADGAWARYSLHDVPHSYYSRVAWALARAGALLGDDGLTKAADRSVEWTCAQQRHDGWIDHMSFTPGSAPLTHTVAYTIEGLLECSLVLGHEQAWDVAGSATRATERAYRDDGSGLRLGRAGALAATIRPDWTSTADYVCLTGSAQMALCCRRIDAHDGDPELRSFGDELLDSAKLAHPLRGPVGVRGGVPGSSPLWGEYGSFKYLNWAAKFMADVLMDRLAGALPLARYG